MEERGTLEPSTQAPNIPPQGRAAKGEGNRIAENVTIAVAKAILPAIAPTFKGIGTQGSQLEKWHSVKERMKFAGVRV